MSNGSCVGTRTLWTWKMLAATGKKPPSCGGLRAGGVPRKRRSGVTDVLDPTIGVEIHVEITVRNEIH